jgi:adenylate kinase family enzyme
MKRAVVIGNSGGGKSTLARRLSAAWKCRHVEIDGLLWRPEWQLTPVEIYHAEHARLIAEENWIVDGLGRLESIPERLARAPTSFWSICRCGCISGSPPNDK